MKKLTILLVLASLSYADTDIYLNQEALQTTKNMNVQATNNAIKNAPIIESELKKVNLDNLDTQAVESETKTTAPYFKAKSLKNKLPDGDKYYLFSESIVSENQKQLQNNPTPLDINKTLSDYNAMIKNAKASIGDNRLLIFISSSMPKKTIVNLMRQASGIGAVFVVRGLINNSYTYTYKYFFDLKGDATVGIMINPTLFSAFSVNVVPTFALYKSDKDILSTACGVAPEYVKVEGELTVHSALEQLSRSQHADLAQIAVNELDILDGQSFYKVK